MAAQQAADAGKKPVVAEIKQAVEPVGAAAAAALGVEGGLLLGDEALPEPLETQLGGLAFVAHELADLGGLGGLIDEAV